MKFIGELPRSDKPWRMASTGEMIILANPDHGTWYVENDKLKRLDFDALQESYIVKMPFLQFHHLKPK